MARVNDWLKGLKRVTSQRFIPEIDGLRFVAIMPVLFMHLGTGFLDYSKDYSSKVINQENPLRRILVEGDLGVLIFFAISGFILALPFAKQHLHQGKDVQLGKYFMRRLTRLEPPYLITLTGFFLVHLIILHQETFVQLLPHYAASFVYIHNLIYGTWTPINPVAWSLEIEVQFYILVPLITRIFLLNKPVRRSILLIAILFAPYIQEVLPLRQWHLQMSIISHYQYFLTGFLMADIFLTEKNETHGFWNILGLAILPVMWWIKMQDGWGYDLLIPLSILLLFISVFRATWWRTIFQNPWITTIGGMCYITYLIHYPLIHLIMRFSSKWAMGDNWTLDFLIQTLIWTPVILIICAIAFRFLEKPFMYPDWPSQFIAWVKGKKAQREVVK